MPDKLWLDELRPGESFVTGRALITAEEIRAFAARYDPQPLHLEPGDDGPFGGVIASGWHTASVAMRLIVDTLLRRIEDPVGLGVDALRWRQPVRPGDELSAHIDIVSVRRSRSDPRRGIVVLGVRTLNQRGEVVADWQASVLVPSRPERSPA